MPSFKIQNRLCALAASLLHCAQRPHVAAFFGRNSRSFRLSAIDVLITGFQSCDDGQDVLGSKMPGKPSENQNPPAWFVGGEYDAVVPQQSRPSCRVPVLRIRQPSENFRTPGILL